MSEPDKLNQPIAVSQADLDDVSDNPEWTDETAARSRSFAEMFPDLAEHATRNDDDTPTQVTLRLDQRVLDHFRAAGGDWQGRINEVLSKAAGF